MINWLALSVSDRFVSKATFSRVFTTVTVIGFSACIEGLQATTGRSASLHDLIANSGGAIAALFVRLSTDRQPFAKQALRWTAFAIAAYLTSGPVLSLLDVARQRRSPATLASFGSTVELERWYVDKSIVRIVESEHRVTANDSGYAMQATLIPGRLPAVQLQQLTRDWTPYTYLQFQLSRSASDGPEPIEIQLRIRDFANDGIRSTSFTERYIMQPGDSKLVKLRLSELNDAAGKPLKLHGIRFVEFFAIHLQQPATIQVGNIRLLNGD